MGIRLGGEGTGGVKTISGDWRSVGNVRERDILVGRCVEYGNLVGQEGVRQRCGV